jgi:predicted nucleotidyltransferase
LLFGNPDRRFYQRQIIQRLALGSGAVQRELASLCSAGLLTRATEGRQTYFQANRRSPVFEELSGLVRKTFGVAEIIGSALAPFAARIRFAFIYGSYAAGKESPISDVDVMVVGDGISLGEVVSALAGAQRAIGREVNPSVYRVDEFSAKLAAGHHFLSAVMGNPTIPLVGDEHELRGLAQLRLDPAPQFEPSGNRRSPRRRR